MLIGIDASRANRAHRTGVEWYGWHVIQELKKIIPPNVRVVVYSEEPLRGELANLPPHWQSRVLRWPPRFLWTHFRLSWEMLTHQPDVLFIPSHVVPMIPARRTVVTIHDVAYRVFPASYTRKGRFYLHLTTWWGRLWARKIITISQAAARDISRQYHIAVDRLAIAPLAYDHERYRLIADTTAHAALCQKIGITQPYFLSVSRLERKKNTAGIIRAFDQFKQSTGLPHQLVLVGKPGMGYVDTAQALDASPYRADIITPGWLADDDLPLLMNGARVFVFPSLYEGFGIPILEAMACGCPVITSTTTACPETAGDAALLVNPRDDAAIAAALRDVAINDEYYQTLRQRGLARASQFTWEAAAQTLWSTLQAAAR